MAELPDTLVFATLPSAQRCAGGHYRQAGSMSASTHMMPSSFLCCYSTIVLQSQTLRRNVYIGMFAQACPPPPQCPAFLIVVTPIAHGEDVLLQLASFPGAGGVARKERLVHCSCMRRQFRLLDPVTKKKRPP